jgi:hypothetical protein
LLNNFLCVLFLYIKKDNIFVELFSLQKYMKMKKFAIALVILFFAALALSSCSASHGTCPAYSQAPAHGAVVNS